MKMTRTGAGAPAHAAASAAIAGEAYVASLRIEISGDGTGQRVQLDGRTFESVMLALQIRQLAFETRTRAFRAHSMPALTLTQKIDRLRPAIEALDNPEALTAVDRLRDIAELSNEVSWTEI